MSEETKLAKIEPNQELSIEQIIVEAVRAGTPVETMERLLAMRTQLKQERARDAFFASLSAFQAECPVIQKTKRVMNKDGKGVRYQYAPLESIVEQIKAIMLRHGFSYTLDSEVADGWVTSTCRAIHAEGHTETSSFKVPVDPEGYMNAAQKVASALTFTSRYAFRNAFGILTGDEDDDGQATSAAKKREPIRYAEAIDARAILNAKLLEKHPLDMLTSHAVHLGAVSLTVATLAQLQTIEKHLASPGDCKLCGKNGGPADNEAPPAEESQVTVESRYEELAEWAAMFAQDEKFGATFERIKKGIGLGKMHLTGLLNCDEPQIRHIVGLEALKTEWERVA